MTGLVRDGDRVVGVETARGPIAAGIVVSAVGGRVTALAAQAGVRLPIRTHPLHAFVTNDYAQGFGPIVASTELNCYVSQTERGQMLIGAEFDAQPSYSRQSSFAALRSYAHKITRILPFLRELRILRTWAGICDISVDFSPIMGVTGRRRLPRHDRLGDVGLQGHPGRRRGDGGADRHRPDARPDRAVRAGPLPARPRDGRPGLGGDPLMLWLDCPRCGRRPLEEFSFGGERRAVPDSITDPDERDFDEVWVFENPDGASDRALVPRGGLPPLADGPAGHERSTRSSRSWRDRAGGSPDRDHPAQPGAVRRRVRSRGCPSWSPRPAARRAPSS